MCFLLGLVIITGLNFGMVSFMTEFLILSVFLSIIFLEKQAAIIIWVLSGLICAAFAILCRMGVLPLVPDFERHVNSIPSWVSFFVTFLFMASIVILIAGDIGNLLAEKLKVLEEKNVALIAANEEVSRRRGFCQFAADAKKSGTMKAIGIRSNPISKAIRMRNLPMEYARNVQINSTAAKTGMNR